MRYTFLLLILSGCTTIDKRISVKEECVASINDTVRESSGKIMVVKDTHKGYYLVNSHWKYCQNFKVLKPYTK